MSDLTLLRPFWLLALPVLVALAVYMFRRAARPGDWRAQIEPHLLHALSELGRVETGRGGEKAVRPFLIAGLIAFALTGPAMQRPKAETFRNLDGVVFVMDVSASMTRDETWPAVVTMARAGLNALAERPAALIVYAGDSYTAATLTLDHLQIGQTITLLNEKTVPDRGARPAIALTRAAEMLAEAEIIAGEVVLFSDGAGIGPEAENVAQRISDLGARLSIVAPETTISGEVIGREGRETLARIGGGEIYGVDEVEPFMADLRQSGAGRLERQDLQLLLLEDYGRWLLLLALIPAGLFFWRERA